MALSDDLVKDVELALGRPLLADEVEQAERWYKAARLIVGQHADLDSLDPETLTYVLTEAVAARLRIGTRLGEKRVDVQVDDARVSREWSSNANGVVILPEWWAMLGVSTSTGVGSTQTYGEPDHPHFHDLWRPW